MGDWITSKSEVSRTSVHKLQGKALAQWYQWGVNHKTTAGCANRGMIDCILFLIAVPFVATLAYHTGKVILPGQIAVVVAGWLFMFCFFISLGRRHLRHAQTVSATDDGLEINSLWLKREIRWTEIEDFYFVGHNENMLDCTNGEEYLLSADLTDSDKLFELINSRKARPTMSYEVSYRIPDGFLDSSIAASVAIILAASFATIWSFATPALHSANDPATIAFTALFVGAAVYALWLNLTKVPQLLRSSKSALYVRTRSLRKVIPLDQIMTITQIWKTPYHVIKTRSDWLVAFVTKEGATTEKLLECKRNLPSIGKA